MKPTIQLILKTYKEYRAWVADQVQEYIRDPVLFWSEASVVSMQQLGDLSRTQVSRVERMQRLRNRTASIRREEGRKRYAEFVAAAGLVDVNNDGFEIN